jgi:RNA polymerase sigma-70 factor (ECF subfamily)
MSASTHPPDSDPAEKGSLEKLLEAARQGSNEALGELIEMFRQELTRIARQDLSEPLSVKINDSDVVQETFMKAQEGFPRFTGNTHSELLAWLRQILRRKLVDARRRFVRSDKRTIRREVPLAGSNGQPDDLALDDTSPSGVAMAREETNRLLSMLVGLPEQYATVIILRHAEGQTFEEIGRKMDRSAEAARKLWVRALRELRERMREQEA